LSSAVLAADHRVERRLYLLRHAEAEMVDDEGRMWSVAQKPLTERGREQAEALRVLFAEVDLTCVHSSPMARTWETAGIVAGGREVRARAALREISLGDFEGRRAEEVFAAEPGFLAAPDARLPGGESFREVADRVEPEVAAILRDDPATEVTVVGHGAVNRAIVGRLLGLDDVHALRLRQDWACANVLEYAAGRWWAGALNYTPAGLGEIGRTRRIAALDEDFWRRLGR
jgi:phosphoserine phosphatase